MIRKRARLVWGEEPTLREEEEEVGEPEEQAQVPAGYNPVYPYDDPNLGLGSAIPMPPFYNSLDFTQNPPGSLALRLQSPMQSTPQGLGIKLGTGLYLAGDGKLSVQGGGSGGSGSFDPTQLTFSQPLKYTTPSGSVPNVELGYLDPLGLDTNTNKLALKYSTGLSLNNGGLMTDPPKVASPLQVNSDRLISLDFGNGLENKNNELTPQVVAPLSVEIPGITLNLGDGLRTTNNRLEAIPYTGTSPIQVSGKAISLRVGPGLTTGTNGLTTNLQVDAPLTLTDGQRFGIRLGTGLQTDQNQLKVALAGTAPITISSGYQVGLSLGGGLQTANSNLTLNLADPLYLSSNQLALRRGEGLELNTAMGLTVKTQAPLKLDAQGVGLNAGAGLAISNNQLGVQFNSSYPIYQNTNGLDVRLGGGLHLASNAIAVDVNNPITINSNKVTLSLGAGLKLNTQGQLTLNLGSGLNFNGSQVETNQAKAPDYTLWTGADPVVNLVTNGSLNARMFLQLTRVGGMVFGSVRVQGITSSIIFPVGGLEVTLSFDTNGKLNSGLSGQWGFRTGATVDPSSTLDARALMPDSNYYYNLTNRRDSFAYCATLSSTGRQLEPCNFSVQYNTEAGSGYQIKMIWRSGSFSSGVELNTTMVNFSYLANASVSI